MLRLMASAGDLQLCVTVIACISVFKSGSFSVRCGHAWQVVECANKLRGTKSKYEGYLSDYSG